MGKPNKNEEYEQDNINKIKRKKNERKKRELGKYEI